MRTILDWNEDGTKKKHAAKRTAAGVYSYRGYICKRAEDMDAAWCIVLDDGNNYCVLLQLCDTLRECKSVVDHWLVYGR
jgi:hypothetical protein